MYFQLSDIEILKNSTDDMVVGAENTEILEKHGQRSTKPDIIEEKSAMEDLTNWLEKECQETGQ